MNTKDIDKAKGIKNDFLSNLPKDKLEAIFGGQKFLMKTYLPIAEKHFEKVFGSKVKIDEKAWAGKESNLHTKVGNFLIKDMLDASIQELAEAIQCMKNWKAWKQTEMETDAEHWKEEMVDALHFFIEALILAGVSAEDIHELYFKKNKVNQFRQRSNY